MKRKVIWWLVFLTAAAPFIVYSGLYFFSPRSIGIDPVEVLLAESGQWALRFLLFSLACSPLKRMGWKKVLRFRRMLGLYAFFYATVHLAIYLFGWIQLNWLTFIEDLIKRPFIYIGMATWLILFLLAISSPKKAVKLLKQNWSRLHKLVYLTVLLAWVHLWMQSRASAAEALLYLGFVAVLLGERIFRKYQQLLLVKLRN